MKAIQSIDNVAIRLYSKIMPTHDEVIQSMVRLLRYECSRIIEDRAEMAKYEDSYRRFVDMQRDAKAKEDHVRHLFAVLGSDEFFKNTKIKDFDKVLTRVFPQDTEESLEQIRDTLSLWEAIKEYLVIVEEASISEILGFLEQIEIKATRQAIESALRQHPETFKTKKKGHEKFVSLKEQ